jgi:hypothetical protein
MMSSNAQATTSAYSGAANDLLAEGNYLRVPPVGDGAFGLQLQMQRVRFTRGRVHGRTGMQARDDEQESSPLELLWSNRERRPVLLLAEPAEAYRLEAFGHHADEGDRCAVHANRLANDRPIAAKPTRPEGMADDDLARIGGAGKSTTDRWMYAERGEEARRDERAAHALGAVVRCPDAGVRHDRRDGVHGATSLAPGKERDRRNDVAVAFARNISLIGSNEPRRLGIGQRAEQDVIGERRDGQERGDAQGNRRDGGKRVRRRMTKAANGELEIVNENLEPMADASLTSFFAPAVEPTKGGHRAPPGFAGRNTGADEIFRLRLEVEAELVVETAVEVLAWSAASEAAQQVSHSGPHHQAGTRMRSTACEKRRQPATSCARCFLPAADSR